MGNHQLPPQICNRKDFEMLIQGSSSSDGGKTEACRSRLGTASVHASVFKPGFVTFVGYSSASNGVDSIYLSAGNSSMKRNVIINGVYL
jgi:hypothetical protein